MPGNETVVSGTIDAPIAPEYEGLDLVKTIIIAGPSHSGKDRLMHILHEKYGWPLYDGTEDGFVRRGESDEIGYKERDADSHKSFDEHQAEIFSGLDKPEAVMKIHQTRLGGIILAEERDKRAAQIEAITTRNLWLVQQGKNPLPVPQEIPAVSVLLWARKDVRETRAYRSAKRLWKEQVQKAMLEGGLAPTRPTRPEILARMNEKEARNVADWEPLHKYVEVGKNPFSRTLSRENGGPVYDRFIDTSEMTPEEVAEELVKVAFSTDAARFRLKNDESPFGNAQSVKDPSVGIRPVAPLPPTT